ncbi:MAG: helix-turn-helix domain-containing protein [Actinobacteria bacterium]|nr:helix-turn-helix domain-containing protein [Actinomycetota bacterium]
MHTEPIGKVLTEARSKLEKSIKEVVLETKIRAKYIEALERDDFECLPGDVYTRGFIKTYATYLGLDPKPLVDQYKELHEQQNDYDISHMSSNMRIATKKRPRWLKIAIGLSVITAVFVGLIAWGAYVSNTSKGQQFPVQYIKTGGNTGTTVAAATTSTTDKEAMAGDRESDQEHSLKTTTTEPDNKSQGDGKVNVTVKLTGIDSGSWVRVKVDGEKVFEGLISDGESKLFKGNETIYILVGNASGLEVVHNGKKLPQLETVNGVAKKTFKKESSNGER